MKRLCMAVSVLMLFTLPACGGAVDPVRAPSTVPAVADKLSLNHTTADERALLAVELAYRIGRTTAETAVDAGLINTSLAPRIADADNAAYSAVSKARWAYDHGQSVQTLIDSATSAVGAFANLIPTRKAAR